MATATIIDHSDPIAKRSNGNTEGVTSVYYHSRTLYRHRDGKFFLCEHGGAAMVVDFAPTWMSEQDAIEWVATEAIDPVTGWGYTREQAEKMVRGMDAGRGERRD